MKKRRLCVCGHEHEYELGLVWECPADCGCEEFQELSSEDVANARAEARGEI